jgi:hypothetical protein
LSPTTPRTHSARRLRYDGRVGVIAELLPHPHGFLEFFFLGMLLSLLVAVGLFALFVVGQLFRNPGRKPRHRS